MTPAPRPRVHIAPDRAALARLTDHLGAGADLAFTAADTLVLRDLLAPIPALELHILDWPGLPGLMRELLAGPLASRCAVHRHDPPPPLQWEHLHAPALELLRARPFTFQADLAHALGLNRRDTRALLEELARLGLVYRRKTWAARPVPNAVLAAESPAHPVSSLRQDAPETP